MTDPLIGTQLDDYRLEGLLGQGGMARVYRGLDIGLQRYTAIKVIDTPYQQDESYIARFQREARAIAQLDHPHIVTVYRYGRVENMLYLAMQYVEGADLHAVLSGYEQDGQLMPAAETTRLIRELGSALDYAHSQGVVHRDIKPSNVMLDADGRAYLTDFGLALLADVGTRGEILGSPHYIAPEQAVSSAGAVPQSDLYALGVILYRMVTGQLPFTQDDVLELMMLHMTAVPPDPRELNPDINAALAAVVLKALAKEPDDRYASGKALADALEAAMMDTAVAAAAAPTLTIMDRVVLDMGMLPPLPAAVTPQLTAAQPTIPGEQAGTVPPPASKRPNFLKAAGAVMILLLITLTLFFLLRNREDTGEPIIEATEVAVNATTELTAAETAVVASVSQPGEVATIATGETASSPLDPTLTPLSEALPQSSGTVYLPVITNEKEQPASIAAASTATSLPSTAETPHPTATPSPTETTPSPTDAPSSTTYQLLIATNKEDSLFVVNQSAEAFPLDSLSLGKGNRFIEGTQWGIEQLAPGDCVTAWKDGGNPKLPDVECNQVGEQLIRKGPERFWKDQFEVFYEGDQIGECNPPEQCLVEIIK